MRARIGRASPLTPRSRESSKVVLGLGGSVATGVVREFSICGERELGGLTVLEGLGEDGFALSGGWVAGLPYAPDPIDHGVVEEKCRIVGGAE